MLTLYGEDDLLDRLVTSAREGYRPVVFVELLAAALLAGCAPGADMLRFPDQHFSVAVLCNSSNIDPSELTRRVADLYLSDVLDAEAS